MASFNRVIILGSLTRDPELKHLPSGTAVCDVSLAVSDKRKDDTGNWIEEVSYFDCVMFGKTGENVAEYMRKGSPLLVEGRLKQDRWEQDGAKRSKVKVIVERSQFIGGRSGGDSGDHKTEDEYPQAAPKKRSRQTAATPAPDDDIPF